MKQTFIGCGMIIAQLAALQAAPRDLNEARLCASEFLSRMEQEVGYAASKLGAKEVQRVQGGPVGPEEAIGEDRPYYLFEDEGHRSFVVVSGSDRMEAIVAYGEGSLTEGTMNPGVAYWLECLAERVRELEEDPDSPCELSMQKHTVVEPLLGKIEWGQGYPYNILCPNWTSAGCTATAMAQVIYYYRYPAQGSGWHTNRNAQITVNFSDESYDYDLMLPTMSELIDNATAHREVAKLMLHCGVLCNVVYDESGSSAVPLEGMNGMINHFDYDPDARSFNREMFTRAEWDEMLTNELTNDRPIIYSAHKEEDGGHCFVLDGVDEYGLYHVNWGWNGWCNGYFSIDVLDPYGGQDGYSRAAQALVQLAPRGSLKNPRYYGALTSSYGSVMFLSKPAAAGDVFVFAPLGVENISCEEVTAKLGMAFVRNGQTAAYAMNDSVICFGPVSEDGGFTSLAFAEGLNVTMPELEDGDYEVKFCAKIASGRHAGKISFFTLNPLWTRPYTCSVRSGLVSLYSEWDPATCIETLSLPQKKRDKLKGYDLWGRRTPLTSAPPLSPEQRGQKSFRGRDE